MGRMKDFAMGVSVELGFDGELNDEVLAEAQRRLDDGSVRDRSVPIVVRDGSGTFVRDSVEFTDTVDRVRRIPRNHSVKYKCNRYQLRGGTRTPLFICLNNPI